MPDDTLDYSAEFLDSEPPHWAARGLGWLIILIVVVAGLAGILVEVPEVVQGPFTLAPIEGGDPVRARKEGTVAEVRVREGDTVSAGATLIVLRSASLADRSGDRRTLETQQRANQDRLRIAASQYDTRKRADQAEERRLTARVQSLQRLIDAKKRRVTLFQELADSAQAGYREGSVNRLEAARLDLEATSLNEEVQTAMNDLDDTRAALVRLARDEEARDLEYQDIRRSLLESMETAHIRIDALSRDLQDLTDSGLSVTSPCRGTVLRLHVATAGAVVRDGETLSEIACAGERLQAELRVPQAGVPMVHPGQAVKLRFDAFPYQRYGVRFGRVRWVGPGGVAAWDSGGFRALVDLNEDSVRVRGVTRPLQAGMGGQADVVIGRRSLVSYAVEPIRALRENFRESPQ